MARGELADGGRLDSGDAPVELTIASIGAAQLAPGSRVQLWAGGHAAIVVGQGAGLPLRIDAPTALRSLVPGAPVPAVALGVARPRDAITLIHAALAMDAVRAAPYAHACCSWCPDPSMISPRGAMPSCGARRTTQPFLVANPRRRPGSEDPAR